MRASSALLSPPRASSGASWLLTGENHAGLHQKYGGKNEYALSGVGTDSSGENEGAATCYSKSARLSRFLSKKKNIIQKWSTRVHRFAHRTISSQSCRYIHQFLVLLTSGERIYCWMLRFVPLSHYACWALFQPKSQNRYTRAVFVYTLLSTQGPLPLSNTPFSSFSQLFSPVRYT